MDRKNNLYEKSLEFAKEIVLLYRQLEANNCEKEITKQLLRSGTSIGANISEAQGSVSEADYLSKIHIAYKELLESKFWIELLLKTDMINEAIFDDLFTKVDELSRIVYTIIRNIRSK